MIHRRLAAQQGDARDAAENDRRNLAERGWKSERDRRGNDGKARAFTV
jgi:hypothetical protein